MHVWADTVFARHLTRLQWGGCFVRKINPQIVTRCMMMMMTMTWRHLFMGPFSKKACLFLKVSIGKSVCGCDIFSWKTATQYPHTRIIIIHMWILIESYVAWFKEIFIMISVLRYLLVNSVDFANISYRHSPYMFCIQCIKCALAAYIQMQFTTPTCTHCLWICILASFRDAQLT